MEQNLEKNKFKELIDSQIADLLEYKERYGDDTNEDKTFEINPISNDVRKELFTVTSTAKCPNDTRMTDGGFVSN